MKKRLIRKEYKQRTGKDKSLISKWRNKVKKADSKMTEQFYLIVAMQQLINTGKKIRLLNPLKRKKEQAQELRKRAKIRAKNL